MSGSVPVNRGFLDVLDRDDRSALIRLGHPRRYRRGAIATGRRQITIRDPDGLQQYAT